MVAGVRTLGLVVAVTTALSPAAALGKQPYLPARYNTNTEATHALVGDHPPARPRPRKHTAAPPYETRALAEGGIGAHPPADMKTRGVSGYHCN
mmetsp:Transcript_34872/g.93205  ORF Transcript_34872/g.93205 Transcript_34872/m.93205 type:complete len:94 (-) Transcript_34872:17-298(-)